MRVKSALGLAFLLTLAQIIVTALFSGSGSPSERYFRLLNWDSGHYHRIAETGYALPSGGAISSGDVHEGRANVVFFPAYPILARELHLLTGISVDLALLLIAHSAAFVVWLYFLLILSEMGIPRPLITGSVIAVLAYPSSFFLVTGYTESLFLAASLGFIYWSDRWFLERKGLAWLAALFHGWVLSATRIVGFAVAAYPMIRDAIRRRIRPAAVALFALSLVGSLGFFAYCQLRFGNWAIYFKLEEIGWHNHRLYFAVFNPLSYVPRFFFENTVDSLSRSSVTFGGFLFMAWAVAEWRIFQRTRALAETRIARACVAFAMFYIALTGKADANMDSMVRYTLPVYMLLVLNFAELNRMRMNAGEPTLFFSGPRRKWKLGAALAVGIGIQCWYMYRFTHGRWVA